MKTVQQNPTPEDSGDYAANDSFTMQLLRCMVKNKELDGQSKEEKNVL